MMDLKQQAQSLTLQLRARLTLAILLLLLTSHAVCAATTPLNRAEFGQNAYPIWSPLSFFERQTIAERHAAEAGDPDALLALYIMASGRYELSDYRNIKKQIDQFVTTLQEKTDGMLDPWQQGELLNGAMHHVFFKTVAKSDAEQNEPPSEAAPPSNYNLDQSALTGIFKNNTFNCISSSLLYAVLARRLGLEGRGVMLPSHAFIQLDFEDSKSAEVETTSAAGYDQHHDAEFYQRAADAWFNPRGLAPSTYNDYLNRELIPFWQLGTRNMLHQHTHPERMSPVDRGRLAEISAFIDPRYEPAQINRMHYYTREAAALAETQQWPTLKRLLLTVMEPLSLDIPSFSHNEPLQNSYFWLTLMAIETHAQLHDNQATFDAIHTANNLAYDQERIARLKNRSVDALNTLLKHWVAENAFENGLYAITTIEMVANDHPHFTQSIAWFYTQWAKKYWQESAWADAVATLEDYLAQPYLPSDMSKTHKNLASAYKNWVLDELSQGSLQNAKAIAFQCEMQHLEESVCKPSRDEVAIAELKNAAMPSAKN
ncbi:MAG TPA: transglutaminase family protein [Marinagarivorans sp.]